MDEVTKQLQSEKSLHEAAITSFEQKTAEMTGQLSDKDAQLKAIADEKAHIIE